MWVFIGDGLERRCARRKHRLCVLDLGAARGGIPVMGHCNVALETSYEFVVEDLGYESHALVHHHRLAVCRRNTGAFLPSVLKREEAEEGEPCDFEVLSVDPEDRAFFSELLHREEGIIAYPAGTKSEKGHSNFLLKKPEEDGFLHMLAVLRLVENDGILVLDGVAGYFITHVHRHAVHDSRLRRIGINERGVELIWHKDTLPPLIFFLELRFRPAVLEKFRVHPSIRMHILCACKRLF